MALGGAPRRELTQTIYEEAVRLNRLVGNLLDMTRLEAATVELKREWHSLEEVVGALARARGGAPGFAARRDRPPAGPAPGAVDALLVQQVLVNLLDNAAKYTPEDATIRVSARARAGAVELDVSDDGPGLPEGDEERVFEKFYRAAGGRDGFGLGLAIAARSRPRTAVRSARRTCGPAACAFRFDLPSWATPPEGREAEADVERA